MNKLFQTAIITSILSIAGISAEINGEMTYGLNEVVNFENGATIAFADNATLHNYTTINCPTADGETAYFKLKADAISAQIIHYQDSLVEDTDFKKYEGATLSGKYYRTMGKGQIIGNKEIVDGITESNVSGDLIAGGLLDLQNNDVAVLVGDNADSIALRDNSGSVVEISQNIANEDTGVAGTAKGLTISGKFKLSGDQSHFINEKVTAENSEIEFVGEKSLFQSDAEFKNSQVVLSYAGDVQYDKDITIEGGNFAIGPDTHLILNGGSFILKAAGSIYDLTLAKLKTTTLSSDFNLTNVPTETQNGVTYYANPDEDLLVYVDGDNLVRTPNLYGIAALGSPNKLHWNNLQNDVWIGSEQVSPKRYAFNNQVILYNIDDGNNIAQAEWFRESDITSAATSTTCLWSSPLNSSDACYFKAEGEGFYTLIAGQSNTITKGRLAWSPNYTGPDKDTTYDGIVFFPHDQTELNTDCVYFESGSMPHMQYLPQEMVDKLKAKLGA